MLEWKQEKKNSDNIISLCKENIRDYKLALKVYKGKLEDSLNESEKCYKELDVLQKELLSLRFNSVDSAYHKKQHDAINEKIDTVENTISDCKDKIDWYNKTMLENEKKLLVEQEKNNDPIKQSKNKFYNNVKDFQDTKERIDNIFNHYTKEFTKLNNETQEFLTNNN